MRHFFFQRDKNMITIATLVKNTIRPLKNRIENILPKYLRVKPAIIQAYLGGEYESRFTLINFPSLYSPLNARACSYDVALYDATGHCVCKRTLTIEAFGSFELCPSEFFNVRLPDLGMFTAKIRPKNRVAVRHLGTISSHIYALYSNKAKNSFVLVHPQTHINSPRSGHGEWISGCILDADKIRKITAIQVNPTAKAVNSTLFLLRCGVEAVPISERSAVIPPMGARMVEWNLLEAGITKGYVSIAASGLPTNNAKPILLTHFEDASFSGMHG
jgi:hypothetical protein